MQNLDNSLAVIGAGYVGLVTAACFASFGYDVYVIEKDAKKLASLKQAKIPIYEPGLTEMVEEALSAKRLHFFSSAEELFKAHKPDIVFVAVGTPYNPDGSCNLSFVEQAIKDVLPHLAPESVVVLKSTVPVGTADNLRTMIQGEKKNGDVAVVNNPEFLKEGTAVSDFLRPERVVIGGQDPWALEKIRELYEPLLNNGRPAFVTDSVTAELAKLAANLMLASRVSVINQISRLASHFKGSIHQIESILRSDSRIGSKYLFAGLGYGGSCFPKDVKSFIHICKSHDIDASLAQSVDDFNESQKLFFVPHVKKAFAKASATKLAILGVAFKPETDDIRESPALANVAALAKLGYDLQVYDPKALGNFKSWLEEYKISGVKICHSAEEALRDAQGLMVFTEWQEFQRLGLGGLKKLFKGKAVFDGKNIYKPAIIRSWGYEYLGVGQQ
jgi:UDPglucose 6-dehydrogenase